MVLHGRREVMSHTLYQTFTIHIFTVFLTDLLELVKQIKSWGYHMSPAEVLTGFELVTIQAIKVAFPTTEVKECFFHFLCSSYFYAYSYSVTLKK